MTTRTSRIPPRICPVNARPGFCGRAAVRRLRPRSGRSDVPCSGASVQPRRPRTAARDGGAALERTRAARRQDQDGTAGDGHRQRDVPRSAAGGATSSCPSDHRIATRTRRTPSVSCKSTTRSSRWTTSRRNSAGRSPVGGPAAPAARRRRSRPARGRRPRRPGHQVDRIAGVEVARRRRSRRRAAATCAAATTAATAPASSISRPRGVVACAQPEQPGALRSPAGVEHRADVRPASAAAIGRRRREQHRDARARGDGGGVDLGDHAAGADVAAGPATSTSARSAIDRHLGDELRPGRPACRCTAPSTSDSSTSASACTRCATSAASRSLSPKRISCGGHRVVLVDDRARRRG